MLQQQDNLSVDLSKSEFKKDECPQVVSNISKHSDINGSQYPSSPVPQKALYIYSNIFDKPNDVRKNPFEFEKYNIQPRKSDEEYGTISMRSLLIVPKKKSELHLKPMKLDDLSHDLDNISVKKGAKSEKAKS